MPAQKAELLHRLAEVAEDEDLATPHDKPTRVFMYWIFLGISNGWEWSVETIREKMLEHQMEWEGELGHRYREPGKLSTNSQ